MTYEQQGKSTEAAKLLEVLVKYTVILGDDDPHTLGSMLNLAVTYGEQGKFTEAVKMHEVLAKYRVILGDCGNRTGYDCSRPKFYFARRREDC